MNFDRISIWLNYQINKQIIAKRKKLGNKWLINVAAILLFLEKNLREWFIRFVFLFRFTLYLLGKQTFQSSPRFTFKRNNKLAYNIYIYIYIKLEFTRVERNENRESRRKLKLGDDKEVWVLIARFVAKFQVRAKLSTTIFQLILSCIQVDDLHYWNKD